MEKLPNSPAFKKGENIEKENKEVEPKKKYVVSGWVVYDVGKDLPVGSNRNIIIEAESQEEANKYAEEICESAASEKYNGFCSGFEAKEVTNEEVERLEKINSMSSEQKEQRNNLYDQAKIESWNLYKNGEIKLISKEEIDSTHTNNKIKVKNKDASIIIRTEDLFYSNPCSNNIEDYINFHSIILLDKNDDSFLNMLKECEKIDLKINRLWSMCPSSKELGDNKKEAVKKIDDIKDEKIITNSEFFDLTMNFHPGLKNYGIAPKNRFVAAYELKDFDLSLKNEKFNNLPEFIIGRVLDIIKTKINELK